MAFDTDVIDDSVESTPDVEAPETEAEEAQAEPEPEQAQDEVDNDGEEQSEDDTPDDESKPDKKPSRASERIQQLIAEKRELEAKYAQLNEQSQQPQQKEQTQSLDGAPVKPNVEDFDLETQLDDYFAAQSKYEEQLDEWKFDQRLKQREQAQQQEVKNTEIQNNFKSRFDTNPKFKDDFEQLAAMMQDKPVAADPMQLYGIDDALDIVQEIAANPDLYYELADMTEQRQYAEYGKLHAQIQTRKSAPKARQSKAPPPPNHTKANAPMKRDQYSGSDDEVMRARGL